MGSISTRGIYIFTILIFLVLVEEGAALGSDFSHSIRNASRIRWKMGDEVSQYYILSAYPAICVLQREAVIFMS